MSTDGRSVSRARGVAVCAERRLTAIVATRRARSRGRSRKTRLLLLDGNGNPLLAHSRLALERTLARAGNVAPLRPRTSVDATRAARVSETHDGADPRGARAMQRAPGPTGGRPGTSHKDRTVVS